MVKNLCDFNKNVTIINKDLSIYSDLEGNKFIFNTINAIAKVDYLELTKEEYQIALFQQKIEQLDYSIKNIKRATPKNEISGKDEDRYTLIDKEVAVRQIWNVSNPYGAFKSFNSKEEAIKLADEINNKILEYYK